MMGDLALVPREIAVLDAFVGAGLFDASAIQVAATVARTSGTSDAPTMLAAALATRAVTLGHVCVELFDVANTVVVNEGEADDIETLSWPEPVAWIAALAVSPAVFVEGSEPTDELRPLVLSGSRLYLERYWRYERLVADELRRRASSSDAVLRTSPELEAILDELFGPDTLGAPDLQRRAALHALTHPLTVIAGGPGTGKTRTVAGILIAAHQMAVREQHSLEIALAAPTAKAASRISIALINELEAPGLGAVVRANVLKSEAMTLHRLLGASSHGNFAHDATNPLVHDLVIVDETSMVSLPMMARLFGAVRTDARLVLVGDPFQLASVEAGAVLGEVTGINRSSPGKGPLADEVIRLERIHRFAHGSAIAALADSIRLGDSKAALEILQGDGAVRWIDPADSDALVDLQTQIAERASEVIRLSRHGDAIGGMSLANRAKVLCATRRGPLGTSGWTRAIETGAALALRESSLGRRWYVARPVIVTRNDYLNQTVNGDVGLVVTEDGSPSVRIQTGLGVRSFAPSQLGDVDTWWAMTIHKSQGSEFDDVIVSLPPAPSPILTRELLYTAVTRARQSVTIVSSQAALESALGRPVARPSGLSDLLWSDA